jgi:ankyrin repeat protein
MFNKQRCEYRKVQQSWKNALHLAVINNRIEIVDCLLEGGANIDKSDYEGRTALHWAVIHNRFTLAENFIV